MRPSRLLFCTSLLIIASTPARALDSNGNGMSDVWEMLHNDLELFPAANPDFAPTADPDGDGQSNLQESIAGTDPFSGTLPEGMFQMQIEPAVWPANTYQLWVPWSKPGKSYVIHGSQDLTPGSWIPTDPIPGTGDYLSLAVSPREELTMAPLERMFFRASVTDQPNPGGPFSPWELAAMADRPDIGTALQPLLQPPATGGPTEPPPIPNTDDSGPADPYDAAPLDNNVDWRRTPEAKYLHIPVSGMVPGFKAVDVSDSGRILFTRTLPVTDYATDPVGYVWDPAEAPESRFRPVLFAPTNFTLNFKVTTWEKEEEAAYETPTESFASGNAPLPAPVGSGTGNVNPSVGLGVKLKAIAEDGSILADVAYSYSEYDGAPEKNIRSGGAKVVFFWEQTNYTTCSMLGTDRGYRGTPEDPYITEDYTAGFYLRSVTDPGDDGVITHQVIRQNAPAPSLLELKSFSTTNLTLWPFGMGHSLHNPALPPEPRITRTGKVLVKHSESPAVLNYVVCGRGLTNNVVLPQEPAFDSISDLPHGTNGWGVGVFGGPFRIRKGDAFESIAGLNGVLSFDRQGNGIGNGNQGRAIWRNARWLTLQQATGTTSPFTHMTPRKITPSGLVWIGNEDGTSNALFIPVEVVAPTLKHNEQEAEYGIMGADELKVAKMERSLDEHDVLDIDRDPHRFYIRIPSRLGGAMVVAKLGTADNVDQGYNDPPTDVPLTDDTLEQQQSQSQLLVSDDVDDKAGGNDEKAGDRTHKVMLDGNVEVSSIKIGPNTYPLGMKVPVKIKKYLTVTIILVGSATDFDEDIIKFKKAAKERYAQIGVHVNFVDKTMAAPPPPFLETNVLHEPGMILTPGDKGRSPNPDVAALVDRANAENLRGAITVFVVRDMNGDERGRAHIRKFLAPSQQGYGNIAVLSAIDMVDVPDPGGDQPQKRAWFTLAHEVMHLLTEAGGHYGHGNVNADPEAHPGMDDYGPGIAHLTQHNLMRAGSSNLNELGEWKRIYRMQELMCTPELFNP